MARSTKEGEEGPELLLDVLRKLFHFLPNIKNSFLIEVIPLRNRRSRCRQLSVEVLWAITTPLQPSQDTSSLD